jgi:hypothetical protein
MHEMHSPQNVSFKMTFDDTLARVVTTSKTGASVKKYAMQRGYFEDNMIEYIWGYLELKKGITYRLDNFNKDTPHPSDPYTLEYAFDDMWPLAFDRKLNCTILHFTHGTTSGYIWIDKSSHNVIKTIGHFKTGSFVVTREKALP